MRLLYVVTEDWYFLSHRLPMARAAGFEVHVATRVVDVRFAEAPPMPLSRWRNNRTLRLRGGIKVT